MSDDTSFPDFDLGEFRYLAARYVKLLIRARWKTDPNFLAIDDLNQWELQNIAGDPYSALQLLAMAAHDMGVLNRHYIQICGSGGIPAAINKTTTIGRLISNIAELVPLEVGGPYHHGTLTAAVSQLKRGLPTNWREVVCWKLLGAIREDLNRLPHPAKPTTSSLQKDTGREVENVFCRSGSDCWRVRYRTPCDFLIRNTAGATYVHHLLQRPGLDVTVAELAAVWDRFNTPDERRGESVNGKVDVSIASDDGWMLDKVALKDCYTRLNQINEQLEKARDNNDIGEITSLTKEKRAIRDEVGMAVKPNGLPTLVGDQNKLLVDRVTKAIHRLIEVVEKNNSLLGTHLDSFISTGRVCTYAPEFPIRWEL